MINVIKSCIYMSYDQSQRYPNGRTTQSCSESSASKGASRSCQRACAYLLNLASPSIPLLRASTALEGSSFCWGYQGRFHCQAFSNSNRQTSWICSSDRADLERYCQQSCSDVVKPGGKTWLKSEPIVSTRQLGWIIGLIVCWLKNLPRLMNCWCLSGASSLVAPIYVVRRF